MNSIDTSANLTLRPGNELYMNGKLFGVLTGYDEATWTYQPVDWVTSPWVDVIGCTLVLVWWIAA